MRLIARRQGRRRGLLRTPFEGWNVKKHTCWEGPNPDGTAKFYMTIKKPGGKNGRELGDIGYFERQAQNRGWKECS